MKFQPDQLDGVNAISKLEAGRIWVHATAFESSVLVPWRGDVQAWPAARADELQASHFEAIVALQPELVIFGSGDKHRFVSPALYRALIERRIGVETMDTAAACRTYNVLVNEGRKVVGAFLLEPAAPAA
ncbi:Mth938-like domain-containing protein [Ideonella sp. DXS29W]|uniref:Mth938-like domain-containing protein n=1 Tax=Ideonella lacteola TaxID=2984193 RepID=A0ABU9BXU3_9BURK